MRRALLLLAWLALAFGQPALAQIGYSPDGHSRGGDSVVRKGATVNGAFAQFQCPGPGPCSIVGPAPLTGGGGLVGIQTFTTAGTFTFTPDPGTSSVLVQVQGSGAGGAGCGNPGGTSNACTGEGGSGGGWGQKFYTSGFTGATIIVGAGGGGGTAGNNAGSNGNASSFTPVSGTACSGAGGTGGLASTPGAVFQLSLNPQNGGSATGCDLNIAGQSAPLGLASSTIFWNQSGTGGAAVWGAGATAAWLATVGPASTAGLNCGNGYGGGGSGANAQGNGPATKAGGNGCGGAVEVYEYGPSAIGGQAGLPVVGEVVTSGSQSSVTFSNIPQTYRDLRLVVTGRGTAAATSEPIAVQINGDAGANYDREFFQGNNTTWTGFPQLAQTNVYAGNLPAASATANVADSSFVDFTNYASTTFQKTGRYSGGLKTGTAAANVFTETGSFWWRNTAGVNQLTVFLGSGAFVDGSVVTLYGIGGNQNASLPLSTPQGRLTLTSGSPVMTGDATAQPTIYYDNYVGNLLPVGGIMYRVGELSDVLNTSAHLSTNLYDVFAYNSSGTIALCTGPAWTNSTTRSAAVSQTNGIWSNTASLTCTISGGSSTTTIAPAQATYLGTFYATANGQTGMQFRPAAGAGGSNNILGLWNAYNRVATTSVMTDSNGTWTLGTANQDLKFDNSTSTRVTMVDGLGQSAVHVGVSFGMAAGTSHFEFIGVCQNSTGTACIGFDNAVVNGNTVLFNGAMTNAWPGLQGLNFYQVEAHSDSTAASALPNEGGQTIDTQMALPLVLALSRRRRAANDNSARREAA